MNTREENVAEVLREADEIERKRKLRSTDLEWARAWHDGCARCPRCGCTEFGLVDFEADAGVRYESHGCEGCGARWKVEFREAALVVLREDEEADWIELPLLSERETAITLAALRYGRRERLPSGGDARGLETAFGRLQSLSDEDIDALCERIAGLDRGGSGV